MARVPVVGGNQLALAPMGARRLEVQDVTAGTREIASGLGRLANQGMEFAEEQDRLQAALDQAAAKKIDADYANYERQVLHTGDAAFYTLEGFNASNARLTVEEQLEKKRQELIAQTANDRQRAMAGDALDRRLGAARQGISIYANKQLRVEETRQSARRAQTAADDAILYYEDPERFAQEIAVGRSEIVTELTKQGAAPEVVQGAAREWESKVYRGILDGMVSRLEIDKAIGYVATHRSDMTEEDQRAIDRALAIPMKERAIDGLADFIMGEGRPPEGVGEDPPADDAPSDPDQRATGFALPMPVEGKITSGFGKRSAPTAGASTDHRALDIAAPQGSPIRAQAAGRVVSAREEGNAGLVVRVDYGNGVEASYAHMEGFDVKEGDAVKPGQRLGGVGKSGNATGYHVHYTLRVNGEKVDPTKFAGVTGRPSGGQRTPTQASGITQEEAFKRIKDLGLPLEEERALEQEVTARFRQDAAILSDREQRARDQVLEILNRADASGSPVSRESAIPADLWDAMAPSDAMAVRNDIRRNAVGPERQTDLGTYLALSDYFAKDPKGFAGLNPADYLDRLSKEDFEQVFGTWRRDAIKEGSDPSKGQVRHETIRSVMAPALEAAGLTLDGIPTKDAEARQAMSERIYRAQKAVQAEVDLFARENPGKPVTDDMIRRIVDRQLVPTRATSDTGSDGFLGFGAEAPTYVPWFERQTLGTTSYKVQIPPAEKERLRRLGRSALGRDPTDVEIARAYFEETRR